MQKRYAWLTCLTFNCAVQHRVLSTFQQWGPAQMMTPLSPHNRLSIKELVRRADRVAADLNVLLVVVAIGLAALDMTFLVTQKVVDNLPPITRVSYETPSPAAK
jgi:hypothetical protein